MDRARRQFSLVCQIKLIGTDILRLQDVGRLAEMACKQRNLLNIGQLSVWREIANLHVLDHSFSKICHRKLLCVMEIGESCISILTQSSYPGIRKYEMRVCISEEKLVLLEYREAV